MVIVYVLFLPAKAQRLQDHQRMNYSLLHSLLYYCIKYIWVLTVIHREV